MKSNNLENKTLTYVNTPNQDNRDDASSLRNHKSSDDEQPGRTKSTNSEGSLPRSRRSEDLKLNRYKCHECTKTFSRPSSLRVHILSHTGEKPHICPQPGCGRRFSVQSNMRRHLKVHYCNDSSHPYQTFAIGKLDTHSSSV